MDGTWQVQDLDSLNGTSLNGQQIKQETLQQDDFLQIGDFMFRIEFRSSGQSQEANERGQRSRQVLHAIAAMLPEPSEIRGEDDLDRTGWSRDHDTPTGWPASTGSSA
jgi:pSer/pThr/pTyr-binding forkhead associated (FHA) protein